MAKQSKAKMRRDQLVYKAITLTPLTRIDVANLYHWKVTDGRCSEVDRIMSECKPAKPSLAAADKVLQSAIDQRSSTVTTTKVSTAKGAIPPVIRYPDHNWKSAKKAVKAAHRTDLQTFCYKEAKAANGGKQLNAKQQAQTWIDAAELLG